MSRVWRKLKCSSTRGWKQQEAVTFTGPEGGRGEGALTEPADREDMWQVLKRSHSPWWLCREDEGDFPALFSSVLLNSCWCSLLAKPNRSQRGVGAPGCGPCIRTPRPRGGWSVDLDGQLKYMPHGLERANMLLAFASHSQCSSFIAQIFGACTEFKHLKRFRAAFCEKSWPATVSHFGVVVSLQPGS